ncbi:HAD family phosphatase [Candidatus Gracilibacteria bacterium]|nr:HAD family phosphatase [Candidatus Gracilibacteria bacterium]
MLLNKINFHKEELELFVSKKDEIVISMLNGGKIELMPYAFEILELLHQNGYKIGISSGACREFIDQFIVYFNLKEIVIASTSSNEVEKKKPNPDVFLTSFKKIEDLFGIPDNKLVIGDGWSDIEGGHKSGAKTIWLNYSKKDKINEFYCDFEIESLKDLKDILGFNN